MANTVTFGMYWQMYGRQTIELPDSVDPHDYYTVREHIRETWDDIGLPGGSYVDDSADFDEESLLDVVLDPSVEQIYDDGFEIAAYDRAVKVVIEDIGEGLHGDYNADDPEDIALLRFTVYLKTEEDPEQWDQVDDASYCTQLPADTPRDILKKAVKYLLKEFSNVLNSDRYQSVKKLGESLSWISPEWFSACEHSVNGTCELCPDDNACKGTYAEQHECAYKQ